MAASFALWLLAVSLTVAITAADKADDDRRYYSLNCAQVRAAAIDLRNAIGSDVAKDEDGNYFRRLIGGFVRLSFHMCTGRKCKGCINVDDPNNIHLDQYVSVLEQLYRRNTAFSRGDFWTLAAMVALVESERLTNRLSGRNFTFMHDGLTFRYGRIDCSPSSPFTSELHAFPDASRGIDHVVKFFADNFNFSADETVVALGAHKLGGMRNPCTHTVVRQWTSPADTLTNDYYKTLRNQSNAWTQTSFSSCANFTPVYLFENVRHKRLMLNVDMALQKNLTFNNGYGGLATCTVATCPDSSTLDSVEEYANSDEAWQSDFAELMMKMVETGYNASELQPPKDCLNLWDSLKDDGRPAPWSTRQ